MDGYAWFALRLWPSRCTQECGEELHTIPTLTLTLPARIYLPCPLFSFLPAPRFPARATLTCPRTTLPAYTSQPARTSAHLAPLLAPLSHPSAASAPLPPCPHVTQPEHLPGPAHLSRCPYHSPLPTSIPLPAPLPLIYTDRLLLSLQCPGIGSLPTPAPGLGLRLLAPSARPHKILHSTK